MGIGDIFFGALLTLFVYTFIVGLIMNAIDYFSKEKRQRRKWIRSVMRSKELTKEQKQAFYVIEVILKERIFTCGEYMI